MEWNDVKSTKPEHDQLCYVQDAEWSTKCWIAIYHKDHDKFVLYDPKSYDQFSLYVTHWVALPSPN